MTWGQAHKKSARHRLKATSSEKNFVFRGKAKDIARNGFNRNSMGRLGSFTSSKPASGLSLWPPWKWTFPRSFSAPRRMDASRFLLKIPRFKRSFSLRLVSWQFLAVAESWLKARLPRGLKRLLENLNNTRNKELYYRRDFLLLIPPTFSTLSLSDSFPRRCSTHSPAALLWKGGYSKSVFNGKFNAYTFCMPWNGQEITGRTGFDRRYSSWLKAPVNSLRHLTSRGLAPWICNWFLNSSCPRRPL